MKLYIYKFNEESGELTMREAEVTETNKLYVSSDVLPWIYRSRIQKTEVPMFSKFLADVCYITTENDMAATKQKIRELYEGKAAAFRSQLEHVEKCLEALK